MRHLFHEIIKGDISDAQLLTDIGELCRMGLILLSGYNRCLQLLCLCGNVNVGGRPVREDVFRMNTFAHLRIFEQFPDYQSLCSIFSNYSKNLFEWKCTIQLKDGAFLVDEI